jgi:hypothetical protein
MVLQLTILQFCLEYPPVTERISIVSHLYEDQHILIAWNKHHQCLEYRWKTFVSSETFKELLEQFYNYVVQYGCRTLLIDARDMQIIPTDVQGWLETDWMPRMTAQNVKNYAVVSPISVLAKMSTDNVYVDEGGINNGVFQDVNQARAWVASLAE